MKKIVIIIVLIALIGIGAWFLFGGEKSGEDGKILKDGKELSLIDIFDKAKGVISFKYDMVATAPGETAETVKMWREGKKMRMEGNFDGKNMVYLVDTDKQLAYMYFPAENTAMKMSIGKVQESIGESPTEQSGSVMQYNPVTLGTETLDGKKCLVIEYTMETGKTKSWVWEKYGLPIKTESTTNEGIHLVELKNIEFGGISDSMFELPTGVQIMQIPGF